MRFVYTTGFVYTNIPYCLLQLFTEVEVQGLSGLMIIAEPRSGESNIHHYSPTLR